LVAAVNLGRARRNFGLGKIAYRVAQGVNIGAELKVKSGQIHGASPYAVNQWIQ
jgi:hypothetical protein